jgi:hypothetical protein
MKKPQTINEAEVGKWSRVDQWTTFSRYGMPLCSDYIERQSVKYTTHLLHTTATYSEKSFFNSVQPDGYVQIEDTYSCDV